MRKPIAIAVSCLLFLSVVAYAQVKSDKKEAPKTPPFEPKGFLVSDTEAYMPLAPEFLAAPKVTAVYPSPDGNYAVILQEDLMTKELPLPISPNDLPTTRLLLWNKKTKQVRVVWRSIKTLEAVTTFATTLEAFTWLPKTNQFIFLTNATPNIKLDLKKIEQLSPEEQLKFFEHLQNQTSATLMRVDASRGTTNSLGTAPISIQLFKSAEAPVFAYRDSSRDFIQGEYVAGKQNTEQFRLVTEQGVSNKLVELPISNKEFMFVWSTTVRTIFSFRYSYGV
jgi:hypothetical protein